MNDHLLAAYGLAMREAQRLECRLRTLSGLHSIFIKAKTLTPIGHDDFESALAEASGKTLGKLIRRFRAELGELTIPLPEPAELDEVLQLRNFLAHKFFERGRDGTEPLPNLICALPGNHRFTQDYLDYIQEPHPAAMEELRLALDHFGHQVRILDGWITKLMRAFSNPHTD